MRGAWLLLLSLCACQGAVQAGGAPMMEKEGGDPLDLPAARPAPGSLDDLYERVIVRSCAGQPGLCHAGQFEPNLSTPAMAYATLVNRPSLEKPKLLRVRAGDPEKSLLIMKLRGRDVSTRMPLGATPLPEEEIARFEAWIRDGALRRPAAPRPPMLNHAPTAPEIAIYSGDRRLDGAGPVEVAPGTPLTLRHSVSDFETEDSAIPFSAFVLSTADGMHNLVLEPRAMFPHLGISAYDPAGPAGAGDLLNFRYTFTVPATVTLLDGMGQRHDEPAAGHRFTVLAFYIDSLPVGQGISTFAFRQDLLQVK
jgi:hypothetical protein